MHMYMYFFVIQSYTSDHTFLEFHRWGHVPCSRRGGIVSGSQGGCCNRNRLPYKLPRAINTTRFVFFLLDWQRRLFSTSQNDVPVLFQISHLFMTHR